MKALIPFGFSGRRSTLLFSLLVLLPPETAYCAASFKVFPTAVFGTYKKENIPIYDVDGKHGLSKYHGKTVKLLPRSATIERSDYYNPGFIEVSDVKFETTYKAKRSMETTERITGPSSAFIGHYEARIRATRDIENVYAVALCMPVSALNSDARTLDFINISFKDIGSLRASQERELKIDVNFVPDYLGSDDAFVLMPIFYSNGYEIRSNLGPDIYTYFRRQEEILHRNLLAQYLENNAGKSLKHTPVIRFLPYLTPDAFQRLGPVDVAAVLTIDVSGLVRSVTFVPDELDAEAAACLTGGLKDWLFLPPLKDGNPTPFRIRVPLKYQ
jgi:hypothetical protein